MKATHSVTAFALLVAGSTAASGQDFKQWSVSTDPAVSVGQVDGEQAEILTNPLYGAILSDGSPVIQNSSRNMFEVRYYSPEGDLNRIVSRWGDGPYEFRATLGLYRLPADTILVPGVDGRWAKFGPQGERLHEGRWSGVPRGWEYGQAAGDLLILGRVEGPSSMPDPGTYREKGRVWRYDPDVEAASLIGEFFLGYGVLGPAQRGVALLPYPFGPRTSFLIDPDRVWVANPESGLIEAYDGAGDIQVRIDLSEQIRAVTGEDREKFSEWLQSEVDRRSGFNARAWEDYVGDVEFPTDHPAFDKVKMDSGGNLWVQRYEVPWADGPRVWDIYSPRGAQFAVATMPASALPSCARKFHLPCDPIMDIGENHVLMRRLGSIVPGFSVHRLVKR